MEDLLEDEDEDFDKDDKVIISRKTGAKKKKCLHTHTCTRSCTRHRRGSTYTRKITHTHTDEQNDFFPFPAISSPPPRSANTVCRDHNGSSQPFHSRPCQETHFSHLFSGRLPFFSLLQFFPLRLFFPPLRRIYDTDAVIPPPASCENTRPYKVLS